MKSKRNMKMPLLLCILCIALFSLAAYFFLSSSLEETQEDTWADSGFLEIGPDLRIQNTDNRLSLLDSKDTLSASGLYYASWVMGTSEPYENSDGDTVDLYDAQLYLCLSEHKSNEEAQKTMTKWLDAGKNNYEVLTEEEIICNGQSYSLITYNCVSESNPYDRGISAFGVCGSDAVCIELTCRENLADDLRTVLTDFLDGCTYDHTNK